MKKTHHIPAQGALALSLLAALLLSSEAAAEGCRAALGVCTRLIIPSLFPFFVLSSYCTALGLPGHLGRLLAPFAMRLYGISGAGASALLIGLTGGYPAGAACIADMEKSGAVTAAEAERLLAFCNNSGPAFLVGAVGVGVFHSVRAGLLLYAVHIAAALLAGLFFRRRFPGDAAEAPVFLDSADPAAALTQAVRRSVTAILNVCGFVVSFSVLLAVLNSRGLLSLLCGFLSERLGWSLPFSRALIAGLFELGSGTAAMEGLALTPPSFALAALLTGWGGLSVHYQTLSLLTDGKAKGALHLTGRLLSASIGAALAYPTALLLL
ncbi:MAG: sporulation protein [Eubacteriales bacterium]|nr:sporulation protein [Eubacteriales bacterium]